MGAEQSAEKAKGGNGVPDDIDRSKYYDGPNDIQLIPGATAYHTSVVINGVEYFFGISSSSDFASHRAIGAQKDGVDLANSNQSMMESGGGGASSSSGAPGSLSQMKLIKMGKSNKTGSQVVAALSQYFPAGHYDLLRKNCNSFSDVAIFYCLGKRIDSSFRRMESLGSSWKGILAGQGYEENPKAEGFDVEEIVAKIDPMKMWASKGYTLGGDGSAGGGANSARNAGSASLTPEEMRRRRLEAIEKRASAAGDGTNATT
ncbi:unnamed protein product [Amoebophrya sp. A25]|nr:unnamed protein product [Amoebophrya sp. A25]|eukprot:GSA25T00012813001.1